MQSQNQSLALTTQTADSQSMSLALSNMTQQLFAYAEENINMSIGDSQGWSDMERRAMIAAEALRLTHGFDLTAIITRGDIMRQIEVEGLATVHPNGYADLTALAKEQGISVGELSDTRALCDTIFPYVTNVLGRPLAEFWSEVGKSKLRELVPALRSLITGEEADHASVRTAVENILNNAAADLITNHEIPQDQLQEDQVRRHAVESLLSDSATMTTRELRQRVRPTRTPAMNGSTLQVDDNEWFAIVHITSREQYELLMRQFGTHVNNSLLNGRNGGDPIRWLRRLFGGG